MVKFNFAWKTTLTGHRPELWKQCGYHAISVLKRGGHINTWFEDEKDRMLSRSAGDVCFLPSYRTRRVEVVADDSGDGVEITAVGLTCKLFGNLDWLSFWEIPFRFDPVVGEALGSAIDALIAVEQDTARHPLTRVVERKKLCFELLALVTGASTLKHDARERLGAFHQVEPAVRKLERNFRLKLKIDELARACALSRSQFYHNFKRIVGLPPLEYQQRLRLGEAKRMLLETEMSVAEIGEAAGWPDAFHFSRIFKQHSGFSPARFRQAYRQGLRPDY